MRNPSLDDLYRRPGFMIRRAHQIAVSLFLDETGALGITNRQYGILFALAQQPGIDQISVARLLGLDRSTTGMVIKKLEQAGLIGRDVGARDRRRVEPAAHPRRRAHARAARRAGAARPGARAVGDSRRPSARNSSRCSTSSFAKFNDSTRVPFDGRPTDLKRPAAKR